MVKTLPDNEFKEMPNPFLKYDFAETDLNEEEWKDSRIDVGFLPQVSACRTD